MPPVTPPDAGPGPLPDLLAPGLRLLVCGSAAGTVSARAGAYYAHPRNRFWPTLHAIGLTPEPLAPAEYARLLDLGIGLTDMAKAAVGRDDQLPPGAYDGRRLRRLLARFRPRVLAFNGKAPAAAFLGERAPAYGRQAEDTEGAAVFVLPSTSPAALYYWDVTHWQAMAACVRAHGAMRKGERE